MGDELLSELPPEAKRLFLAKFGTYEVAENLGAAETYLRKLDMFALLWKEAMPGIEEIRMDNVYRLFRIHPGESLEEIVDRLAGEVVAATILKAGTVHRAAAALATTDAMLYKKLRLARLNNVLQERKRERQEGKIKDAREFIDSGGLLNPEP